MRRAMILLSLLCAVVVFGCKAESQLNPNSTEAITGDDIMYHINYLASDALQGRQAGSEGERQAADYIASEFKRLGLKPAGKGGSFYHTFEVIAGVAKGKKNALQFDIAGESLACQPDSDFVPVAFTDNGAFEGEVVFAGYGIEAPDQNYNDYEGLQVTDKVVIVLRFSPDGDNPHSDFYNH
ncbi:MAG: hypothetical protein ACE5I1_29120 [bacterium]